MLDQLSGTHDGSIEVEGSFSWVEVVFPACSFCDEAFADRLIGKSSTGQGQRVGEVGR